jgi:hypothetical protein
MKFNLSPMLVALLCAGCVDAQAAAITASISDEPQLETRTVLIDNGVAVESETRQGQRDLVAQSGGDTSRKQIHIVTKGQSASATDFPDLDLLVSNAMSEAFAGAANMPLARSAKNAPYSAEVVSEKIQTLPDGNQITKRTSTLTYRDSAGRTRQETRDSKGEVVNIHIFDTADGTRYVLNPARKTATKVSIDKNMLKHVGDIHKHAAEVKEKAQAMAKEAKVQILERKPGEDIVIHRIESSGADGSKEVREEMKVNVVRVDGNTKVTINGEPAVNSEKLNVALGSALGELTRLGPIGASFRDTKWSAKSTVTQLGTKDFDGVRAEGKSTSYTIPAGEIGNKNPITVTSETWFSPDLQATVYSKNSDPRTGDTIYRLSNIKRSEQPMTLFTVPEGYTLKETPGIAYNFRTEKK